MHSFNCCFSIYLSIDRLIFICYLFISFVLFLSICVFLALSLTLSPHSLLFFFPPSYFLHLSIHRLFFTHTNSNSLEVTHTLYIYFDYFILPQPLILFLFLYSFIYTTIPISVAIYLSIYLLLLLKFDYIDR